MLIFIDPEGNYPKYLVDVQLADPMWVAGQALPEGWQLVEDVIPPEITKYQVLEEQSPSTIDGVLSRVWSVRDMTAEEREVVDVPLTIRTKLENLGLSSAEVDFLLYKNR